MDLSNYKITLASNADVTLGNVTTSNVSFGDVTITQTRDFYNGGNGLSVGSVVTNNLVVSANANIGGQFNFGNGSVLINSVETMTMPSGLVFGNFTTPHIASISRSGTNVVLEAGGINYTFGVNGKLQLPAGGDIVDNNSTSVLGGGGTSTGDVTFDGYRIDQSQISQDVRVGVLCNSGTSTVIYVAQNNRHSVRLFVQVEGHEGGGNGTWDTQACDVIAVQAFRDNSVSCSVFGITHTSTDPLATFSAQYNPTSERLEVLCTPTNADTHVYVSCQSIEINNND